jgi:hypothetical protein
MVTAETMRCARQNNVWYDNPVMDLAGVLVDHTLLADYAGAVK